MERGHNAGTEGSSPAGQASQLQQAPQPLPSGTWPQDPSGMGPSGPVWPWAQAPSPLGLSAGARALRPPLPPLEDFQSCRCSLRGVGNRLWALAPASQPRPQPHSQLVPLPVHWAPPHSSGQALGLEKGPRSPPGGSGLRRAGGRQGWREEAGLLGSSGEPSEGVSPFSYTPGLSSSKGSVSEPSESCLGLRPVAGIAKNQRGLTGLGQQKLELYPVWAPPRMLPP